MSTGPDTSPGRSGEGLGRKESVRQPAFKLNLLAGGEEGTGEDCLCYTGVHNCVSHRTNTVCLVIQEESEPSSGSVHSSDHHQVEHTVQCDFVIKYNKKVKVIKKTPRVKVNEEETMESNVDNDTTDFLLGTQIQASKSDHTIPVICRRDEDADSGTESVTEIKDSGSLYQNFVLSSFSVS